LISLVLLGYTGCNSDAKSWQALTCPTNPIYIYDLSVTSVAEKRNRPQIRVPLSI